MKKLILSSIALTLLSACSSSSEDLAVMPLNCVYPGTQTAAPGWVCDEPVPDVEMSAMGIAEKSHAGYSFMKKMATTDALVQLAGEFKVQVQNRTQQYIQTTGAASSETVDKVLQSVSKTITNETLAGAKVIRSITAPDGKLIVLVGLNPSQTQTLTKNALKTSMRNDQALWQEFKANKALDEMAADIATLAQ